MDPSQDWFLRQLMILTDGLRGLHDRSSETEIPEPTNDIGNEDVLPAILKGLVENGQIDEAENLLFRCIENYPLVENYEIGLDFYTRLVNMKEAELAAAGWSREEIKEGLSDLHRLIFGEPIKEEGSTEQ